MNGNNEVSSQDCLSDGEGFMRDNGLNEHDTLVVLADCGNN